MITIRFRSSGFDRSIRVAPAPGARQTLLSVAAAHGVPILFNCRSGDCGACLVRVRSGAGRPPASAPLSDAERYRLQAMGLVAEARDTDERTSGPGGEEARLACQYVLDEDDDGRELVVTFASGLGSS